MEFQFLADQLADLVEELVETTFRVDTVAVTAVQ
jgi:hypothetical protein